MRKWLGKKECDICKVTNSEYFVDGKTIGRGAWAFMCAACWKEIGIGKLGTGFGQKYNGITLEKIAG